MTSTQDRITELRRQKTPHSTAELDRLGWKRYEQIGAALEPDHRGRYLMIEVESGDWFLGDSPQEALARARRAHPGKAFCHIRVGYPAAHKLKRG